MPDEQKVSTETALLMLNAILREQLESALDMLVGTISGEDIGETFQESIQRFIDRVRPKKPKE